MNHRTVPDAVVYVDANNSYCHSCEQTIPNAEAPFHECDTDD